MQELEQRTLEARRPRHGCGVALDAGHRAVRSHERLATRTAGQVDVDRDALASGDAPSR
jgi:hypothetical protein